MSLTLVVGRANAGKTGEIHARIRTHVRGGAPAVLLLPAEPDIRRALRELAHENLLGLKVAQFDAYLEELWRLHGDGRCIATRSQMLMHGRECLRRSTLTAIEPSAASPGFAATLVDLFGRASECGDLVSTESCAADAEEELASLLVGLRSSLQSSNLVGRGEALRRLSASLLPLQDTLIAVNRFTDLTAAQAAFVRSSSAVTDVVVSLPWEDGFEPTRALSPLIASLRPEQVVHKAETPLGDHEIRGLEAFLFAGPRSMAPSGSVSLSLATGDRGEAERIAAEVASCLETGTRPERIAVVYRQPEGHVRELTVALGELGIPADVDVPAAVRSTAFGRALRHLTRFAVAGTRNDLVALLRSPFSSLSQDDVDSLEAYWRRWRIVDPVRLMDGVRKTCPKVARLLRTARSLALQPLDEVSARHLAALVTELLAEGLRHHEDELDARVQGLVVRTLGEMAAHPGRFGVPDLLEVLDEVTVAPREAERAGRVQVLGIDRIRGRRFDVVVLGGLTAGEFPRPPREEFLSSEVVAGALRRIGVDVDQATGLEGERLMLYLALSRARDRVVLSRRAWDDEGREVAPSVFWDEILDAYRVGQAEDAVAILPPQAVLGPSEAAGETPAARSPRRRLQQLSLDIRSGRTRAHVLVDGEVRSELARREVFSASELEDYVACPYRWFHRRIVSAEGLDAEIGGLEAGTVAHAILQRLYAGLQERTGARRPEADRMEEVVKFLDEIYAQEIDALPEVAGLEERERLRLLRRRLHRFVVADAAFLPGWLPTRLEWRFGLDEGDQPEDLGGFKLRGSVDRIDEGPGAAVVSDYKSGAVWPAKTAAEDGRIQLQLYAEVVRRRLGLDVVGAFYRSLKRPCDRGPFVDGIVPEVGLVGKDRRTREEFEEGLRATLEAATRAVEGIRDARIDARPRNANACAFCDAAPVCGRGA